MKKQQKSSTISLPILIGAGLIFITVIDGVPYNTSDWIKIILGVVGILSGFISYLRNKN